jgi:hypothetical protein
MIVRTPPSTPAEIQEEPKFSLKEKIMSRLLFPPLVKLKVKSKWKEVLKEQEKPS